MLPSKSVIKVHYNEQGHARQGTSDHKYGQIYLYPPSDLCWEFFEIS